MEIDIFNVIIRVTNDLPNRKWRDTFFVK